MRLLVATLRGLWLLVRACLWAVVTIVLLAGSLAFHSSLPLARNALLTTVNSVATGEIRGELSIGRIDELTWDHIVARHVMLYDAHGRRIIVADRVVFDPDIDTLVRQLWTQDLRSIHVVKATLVDGIVHLIDDGTGSPTLFSAFDARNPSVDDPNDAPPPLVTIENIELREVTLYGEILGLKDFRVEHVLAHGTMNIDDEIEIDIQDARGEMTQPFGFVGHVDALSGTISTRTERGIVLRAKAHRDHVLTEVAEATITYKSPTPGAEQELDIFVDARGASYDTLERFGYTWAEPLDGNADAQLRLHGPTHDLELQADVQSAGGRISVQGEISDDKGVTIHFATESLSPEKLVPAAPAVSLKGTLQLTSTDAEPEPRLHAELDALRYKGFSIPAVEIDAVVEETYVRIQKARSRAAGARLSAHGTVDFEGGVDLNVDASFPAMERDPNLSRYIDNVKGKLDAKLRVQTPSAASSRLNIDGSLELTNLVYGSIMAAKVTLLGSAHGDPSLPTLKLEVRAEQTSVMAYALGNARFALNGGPRGYQAEGEFQAKGQKTFFFSAKVAANRKGFVVQADPIEFAVGNNTWRGLARDVTVVHGDRVELGLLRLASRSQRLEAQGVVRIHGEDSVSAQLQDFDLAALYALLGDRFPFSEGRADSTVELQGDVANPDLLLQGALRNAKALGVEGINSLYSITYKNGRMDLDTEVDVSGRGTLNARGTAEFDPRIADPREMLEQGRYDLDFSGTDFDLTLIPGLQKQIHEGTATGQLLAKGTLDKPEITSTLTLNKLRVAELRPINIATDLQYKGKKIAGGIIVSDERGALGTAKGSIVLDWAQVRQDPEAVADALLSGAWKLSGKTEERRLDELPIDLPAQWSLPVIIGTQFDLHKASGPTEGTITFTAKTSKALDYQECDLHLRPELQGKVKIKDGLTSFSFTGKVDDKRIASGKGDVDVALEQWLRTGKLSTPSRVNLEGKVDLDTIEGYPWLCKQGRGNLHVSWKAKSLFSDKPSASVKVSGSYFPRVIVKTGRRNITINSCGKEPIALSFDAKVDARNVTVTGKTDGCKGGPMDLRMDMPISWPKATPSPSIDDQRETRVELDFKGTQLRPLLDRIPGVLSFAAIASGHASIKGSARGVDYRGNIGLSKGKLYPIATGQEIRDLTASITGNGTWAKIDHLHATAGDDGSLDAAGGIGFDRWSPKRLQLALLIKSFPIQREGVDLAWLTGSTAIVTDIGEERARTAIKLHTLAIRLPNASSRSLQGLEEHPDIELTNAPVIELPDIPYVLEFFVDGQRRVTVKRNDFEATVRTELAMSYQDPAFRVGGYVEFVRGKFNVFGKDFVLNRGSMHFDGTGELNPEVNMIATYEPGAAGGSPVVVTVTGTLANPRVAFYSEGCPGDGAVVMLVSGRCPDQDSFASGDPESDRNAFAAGIVGGILTLGAQRELGGLIPRISVESTGQGSQARFKAGFDAVPSFMRSLVQRVYVQGALSTKEEAAAGTDPTADSGNATLDFLIELYFPHNIVGAGRFAPDNYWGLDVTWEP